MWIHYPVRYVNGRDNNRDDDRDRGHETKDERIEKKKKKSSYNPDKYYRNYQRIEYDINIYRKYTKQ